MSCCLHLRAWRSACSTPRYCKCTADRQADPGCEQGWICIEVCHVTVTQGILPNLAKVAPAAGISWFVFEETKRMMGMDPHS